LYDYVDFVEEGAKYTGEFADLEFADRRYWGIRKITCIEFPQIDITNENAYEKIFGGFRSLADKNS
jgi:hypothetical protein